MAGVVLLARVGVSSAFAGQTYTFDALAAVLLGGTTFQGGRGGIVGTLAGVLGCSIQSGQHSWPQF
jgi:ribose/xylose/arabinose/galactoside ABC-type transport system permease subunit